MGMTAYLKDQILGATLLGTPWTAPNTVYISLATSANSLGTVFNEVSAFSYSRKNYRCTAPNSFGCSNASTISFGTALETWGIARHVGIWDAPTGGNMLYLYRLSGTGRKIIPGQAVLINSASFTVQL